MNESEKIEALQQIWDEWDGDITCENDIWSLEAEMHQALKPNKRELNKLAHDIFIHKFIREKMQEWEESHELATSPNTYYGV